MAEESRKSTPILEYRRHQPRDPARIRTFGEEMFKLAALATAMVVYGVIGDRRNAVDAFFLAGWIIWLGIAVACVARAFITQPAPRVSPEFGRTPKKAILILLLIALTVCPASFLLNSSSEYSCPHGWQRSNNQIGIAWSANGGPCGNGPHGRGDAVWCIHGNWYIFLPSH